MINDDGSGLLDIRFDPKDECPDYFEQCCQTDLIVEPKPPVDKHVEATCGRREESGIGFKITNQNDHESEFGEFPWQAAILKEEHVGDESLTVFQCGGSLIHPSVVLTGGFCHLSSFKQVFQMCLFLAAHCVDGKDPKSLIVRLGEWDTQTKNEPFAHVDYAVKDVTIHKSFKKSTLHNDIALVFLAEPAKLEPHINTICLSDHQAFEGDQCFVSGWGKDSYGREGKYQVILKKIQVPVMSFGLCQTRLRTTRLGKWFKLHERFMCAGGEAGKDACRGDGGSALVCPLPGKPGFYYQAGIVSWGISCGDEGIPGVYVNVANYQLWIEEQLKLHQLQVESTQKPNETPQTTQASPFDVNPTTENILTVTEPTRGSSTTSGEHVGEYVSTSTARPSEPKPLPSAEYSCGLRNEEGVGFRITGNMDGEAEYGEFPWMVAVMKEEEAADTILNVYVCGGSLIHPLAVLTGLF